MTTPMGQKKPSVTLRGEFLRAERHLARAVAAEAKIATIEALLAEYERTCNPAPYTSERALYERLRHVLPAESQDDA